MTQKVCSLLLKELNKPANHFIMIFQQKFLGFKDPTPEAQFYYAST